MKRFAFALLFAALVGCHDEEGLQIPADLDSLPIGLTVTHSPNLVAAEKGGRSGFQYTWSFTVSVKSTGAPVQIEQYGAFVWDGGQWVFRDPTGKPFPAAQFAKQFGCAKAHLESGKTYTSSDFWSGADQLRAARCKWYFIGVDERGRRVKGEAIVEELARLKD